MLLPMRAFQAAGTTRCLNFRAVFRAVLPLRSSSAVRSDLAVHSDLAHLGPGDSLWLGDSLGSRTSLWLDDSPEPGTSPEPLDQSAANNRDAARISERKREEKHQIVASATQNPSHPESLLSSLGGRRNRQSPHQGFLRTTTPLTLASRNRVDDAALDHGTPFDNLVIFLHPRR